MSIFDYKNFFKKKEEEKQISKSILSENEIFDVEKFNNWFCNDYDGYDGRKGARGIFLRLDKLSPHMITDWFDHLNIDYVWEDENKMMELVRKNWRKKLKD